MTIINSYSVSLGLNAQDYIKNSALSRAETALLKREINSAKTPVEKYAQTYDLLEKALAKQSISLGTYKRLLDEARAKVEQFNTKVRESVRAVETKTTKLGMMVGAFTRLKDSLGPINSLLATYVGLTTAKKAFALATEAEDASIAFEVLTGSATDSLVLMRELREFAEKSPITFGGATQAARTLLSFNVAAQDVIPTVKMLGDAVGGNNERFKMLSLAYAQMSAAGRLMGQDLLQMVNAGFNPLQTISKLTGESLIELKERMSEGAISSAEVANAFQVATSAGGRFHGMTERLSQTMSGKLNIAISDLEKAGVRLGNTIGPLGTDFAKGLADAAEAAGPVLWVIQKMTDGIRLMLAFIKDSLAVANAIATKMGGGTIELADALGNVNKLLDEVGGRQAAADAKAEAERTAKMSERLQQKQGAPKESEEAEKAAAAAVKAAGKAKVAAEKEALKLAKERAAVEKRAADEIRRQQVSALNAAAKHFELEHKKQMDRMKQLRSTPNSSLEVGSEAAVSYRHQRRNDLRSTVMQRPTPEPTQRELLVEARKQLAELKIASAKQERMVAAMNNVAQKVAENGFKRLR